MSDMSYTNIAEQSYGKVISKVDGKIGDDDLRITFDDGSRLHFMHYQDCCECVFIEDVDIDLTDLVGSRIVNIEEACKCSHECDYDDSTTWTFYKIQTTTQCATIRWCGTSNGYYSEAVDWEYHEGTSVK